MDKEVDKKARGKDGCRRGGSHTIENVPVRKPNTDKPKNKSKQED